MTEREAIEWLKGCVVSYEVDNKGKPNGNITCDLTQEVLDMAISALEKQEQDRWIPVTKRLPEEETDVLICNVDGDIAISRGSMSTELTGSWIWYTSGWRFGKVTAWRQLPELYKAEEES